MFLRMTSLSRAVLACAPATFLIACTGGTQDDGLTVSFAAQAAGTPQIQNPTEPDDATVFRRADGLKIDLERGLVVISAVRLEACPSVALSAARVLAALNPIGTAHAHGGDGPTPAGSVSVLGADPTAASLGDLTVAPGRYCGVTVQIRPGAADPATAGQPTDMANTLVSVAPCYYPSTIGVGADTAAAAEADRSCTEAKITGGARTVTLNLPTPVVVDAASRTAAVSIRVRHETWFENIDMAALATDAIQQAMLLDNVAASLVAVTEADQLVALEFRNQVAGHAAECAKVYDGVGAGAITEYQLSDFRYYVTDLTLSGPSGSQRVNLLSAGNSATVKSGGHDVALMGFLNGCSATADARREQRLLQGTVAAGNYTQACFTLGLPADLNHLDPATAPSPINVSPMLWSWLGGRKFVRIDGVGNPNGARANFFLHLGSTGCTNATGSSAPPEGACTTPNLPQVCLDYTSIAARRPVLADVAPVFADVDVSVNTPGTAAGCMSGPTDPECITVMPKLGLDFSYSGALYPATPQRLFTVAAE